jgi:hypothetical protein
MLDDDNHVDGTEMRLPTVRVIYEHGEPWWNDDDVDRGKFLTRPPKHSGNSTSRDIWQQAGEMGKKNENVALRSISVHTCK